MPFSFIKTPMSEFSIMFRAFLLFCCPTTEIEFSSLRFSISSLISLATLFGPPTIVSSNLSLMLSDSNMSTMLFKPLDLPNLFRFPTKTTRFFLFDFFSLE